MNTPRINDLPKELRPREKLLSDGPGALSNAELIAIFLRVGVAGQSAIHVAQQLLDTHGGITHIARLDSKEITRQHGIGPAKACQIAAAFELGKRLAKESIKSTTLSTPEQIYALMQPLMASLRKESLQLLLVDSRLKHLHSEELSFGTLNETICHPRDVLHPVVLHQAYGFILVHNHPSGDPSPSEADKRMTGKIAEASELLQIRFVDHLIVGSPASDRAAYYSFREHGQL